MMTVTTRFLAFLPQAANSVKQGMLETLEATSRDLGLTVLRHKPFFFAYDDVSTIAAEHEGDATFLDTFPGTSKSDATLFNIGPPVTSPFIRL